MRLAFFAEVAAAVAAIGSAVGCGSDGYPLGGPWGGESSSVAPPSSVPMMFPPPPPCSVDAGGAQAGSAEAGGLGTGTSRDGSPIPTWRQLYQSYLSTCAAKGCHQEMSTPRGAYAWLQAKGQISGTSSKLVDPAASCLKWYGGDMPPCGSPDARGAAELKAWADAGAPND
jgi:hypothetical protein